MYSVHTQYVHSMCLSWDLPYMISRNAASCRSEQWQGWSLPGGWRNFEKAHSILHKVHEIVLGNSDNTSCQAPEVHTWCILVHTQYILVCTSTYSVCTLCQHAHIENIKTVANLTTTRMCSCASCVSMCGMGVSAVQGCDACKMLSLQSAKEALPFHETPGWLLFKNSWTKPGTY